MNEKTSFAVRSLFLSVGIRTLCPAIARRRRSDFSRRQIRARIDLPKIIFGLFVLCLLAGGHVETAWAETPTRPNIVLLMGDDHGWEETGYNGHPYLKTPTLDEMAASGLRMDRFYAAHPSCSPTRGSVLTGRHPNRYGTFYPGCSLRPEEVTIARLLQKAGYATGHFGKWHVGPVKAASSCSTCGAIRAKRRIFSSQNPTLRDDCKAGFASGRSRSSTACWAKTTGKPACERGLPQRSREFQTQQEHE